MNNQIRAMPLSSEQRAWENVQDLLKRTKRLEELVESLSSKVELLLERYEFHTHGVETETLNGYSTLRTGSPE